MIRGLLVASFTLGILSIVRMIWTINKNRARENKATGMAALAGSIVEPRFLLVCAMACAVAYFIASKTGV